MTAPLVSDVRITATLRRDQDAGLVAYVRATVAGALVIDGLTIRRTRGGAYALSFPSRRDRRGLEHPYFMPLDREAERAIEEAVLAALLEQSGGGAAGAESVGEMRRREATR